MAHKLKRFSESILSRPQLLSIEKFEELSSFFAERNADNYELAYQAALEAESKFPWNEDKGSAETSVGVININGPLTYRRSGWEALCGGGSYESYQEQMDEYCTNPDVKDILLAIDSGGGEAYGCFLTATALRNKADASGKRLIAYIDQHACSAAYALAAVAHEVIAHPDANVGSIGAVIQLVDQSKMLEKEGIKRIFITAGDSKVPFAKDGSFKEDFLSGLQEDLTVLYDEFINHVATYRKLSTEVVKNTQAKVFKATNALDLGLIDSTMEPEAFYTYLAGEVVSPQQAFSGDTATKVNSTVAETQDILTQETSSMSKLTQDMFDALQAELAGFKEKESAAKLDALTTDLKTISFLADNAEQVASFLLSDVSEDHKELLNAVISSAKASNTEALEAAATKIEEVKAEGVTNLAAANARAEAAEAESLRVKSEFGKPEAITGDPEGKHDTDLRTSGDSRTAELEAYVQSLKSNT